MSVKNFKISTGLDLNGLVLEQGTGNALLWNNATLATQQYVIDSLVGVDFNLSDNAGAYLDWNSGTSQFDVDAAGLVSGSSYLQYINPAGPLDVNIFGVAGALVSDGGSNSAYIVNVMNSSMLDLNISALVTELTGNQGLATESYANTAATTAISNALIAPTGDIIAAITSQGYITSSTEFVQSASAPLSVNSSGELSLTYLSDHFGVGSSNDLQINTGVIATKAYVDGVASGLDIKASVKVASTTNYDFATDVEVDGINITDGSRVLLKNQTDPAENGIYVYAAGQLNRTSDATLTGVEPGTLTKGSFVFVESGTNAGKGFVVSALDYTPSTNIVWTQFSETGNYITSVGSNLSVDVNGGLSVDLSSKQDTLTAGAGIDISSNTVSVKLGIVAPAGYDLVGTDVDGNLIVPTVDTKQNTLTAGNGIDIDSSSNISIDLNEIAGPGIAVNASNQLEAAPGYISSVDSSFNVSVSGQLSLASDITVDSVSITDSVANVTAASDVFGNASASAYDKGSNETIGTLPTGTEVADVFITLKSGTDPIEESRTSKITVVFTGSEAPTWTEYGIITSGWSAATIISFDSSRNIIVNVAGSGYYSAKGVWTTLK